MRERLALDGAWNFYFDPDDISRGQPDVSLALENIAWRTSSVPSPWQAQFDDLRQAFGIGWYRRIFHTPADWHNSAVILHFGAVSFHARVWLNSVLLGEHEGGYLPFEFEVSEHLRTGVANELIVRAILPSNDPQQYPDYPFAEIPHGKQSWYGPLGGIWQSVWVERRTPLHMQSVRVLPDLASGRVLAHIRLSRPPADANNMIHATLQAPIDQTIASTQAIIPVGADTLDLTLTTANPLAWSPNQPHLYTLRVQVLAGTEILDEEGVRFGFRTIQAQDGKLFLNGEPMYLRAALDQDYYPDTLCTPPSEELLEDQLRKAKELGFNCLRCHIKVPDPRYYEVADRLGMLVWTELPSSQYLTPKAAERARTVLREIVERDGNHPSIIIRTIINENWGTDLTRSAEHRRWLRETYHWLKRIDSTRLVVDNSPCWPNFHVETDLDDYHFYRAMPEHRQEWDKTIAEFASRPAWTFSPYGDAVRRDTEPLLVSEFGNWSLPDVENLLDDHGCEPWWFETGLEWGRGAAYPHGVRNRFHNWHLDQVFENWRSFVEATQWHQYRALKHEIESMRRQPDIAGYVVTELTDVLWEANGLLDMRRNPKAFHQHLAAFNADTIIAPAWERVAFWSGEEVRTAIHIAHGAGPTIDNAILSWSLDMHPAASGEIPVPALNAPQVTRLGFVSFAAPEVMTPVQQRLNLALKTSSGHVLATNYLDLAVFPHRNGPPNPTTSLWSSSQKLAERLDSLGYRLTPDPRIAAAIVAHQLDEDLLTYVRDGGRLLLLADHANALGADLPGHPPLQLTPREQTFPENGDWISTFAWLRRTGPFAYFPGNPLLDFSFERIMPACIVTGLTPLDFEVSVHAGIFMGWIHNFGGLIVERRYGAGRIVLCTLPLTTDAPGIDPVATTLLDALVELTAPKLATGPKTPP